MHAAKALEEQKRACVMDIARDFLVNLTLLTNRDVREKLIPPDNSILSLILLLETLMMLVTRRTIQQ